MNPRRLLIVTDEMEVGGTQRQIVHLAEQLDPTQWQVEVAYFRNSSFLVDQLRAHGIPVHDLAKQRRIDLPFIARYVRFLRRGRFDLIHAFSLTAELWSLVAARLSLTGTPMVSSVRCLHQNEKALFWPLKRGVMTRSRAVVANSRVCAEVLGRHYGWDASRFDVIPNALGDMASVDQRDADALRASLVPAGRLMGLFAGRLVGEKCVDTLIDALARLPSESRPVFAIAGDGPERAALESHAASAGVADNVKFLGERSDIPLLLRAADFLVLPSLGEGLSNVVLEAMGAGCPPVVSDVGGNRELVEHEVNGLRFPCRDTAALAAAIQSMNDEPTRERYAAASLQRVRERYTPDRLARASEAVYGRCVGTRLVQDTGSGAGQVLRARSGAMQ